MTQRRCRPYLGTFVEIGIEGVCENSTARTIDRAFSSVARVHERLNAHDEDSELSYFNKSAGWQIVSEDLGYLLNKSQEFYTRSSGAINPVIGGTPMDFEVQGQRAQWIRPAHLDFSGMAKGYAVDQAFEILKSSGAHSGWVNAGGDLRVFGQSKPILVRRPGEPFALELIGWLQDGAVATSSDDFSPKKIRDRQGEYLSLSCSVSVFAPTCLEADAYTKWMLLDRPTPAVLRELNVDYRIVDVAVS